MATSADLSARARTAPWPGLLLWTSLGALTVRMTDPSVGVERVYDCVVAGVKPAGKLDKVQALRDNGDKIAFVGDGVNGTCENIDDCEPIHAGEPSTRAACFGTTSPRILTSTTTALMGLIRTLASVPSASTEPIVKSTLMNVPATRVRTTLRAGRDTAQRSPTNIIARAKLAGRDTTVVMISTNARADRVSMEVRAESLAMCSTAQDIRSVSREAGL